MKIDHAAARVAARFPFPWIILGLGAAVAVLDTLAGQPLTAMWPTVLAVLLALALFGMRYHGARWDRDLEQSRTQREAATAELLRQSEAVREELAKQVDLLAANGCPKDCAGCVADRAESDQRLAEYLHERAARHGHGGA